MGKPSKKMLRKGLAEWVTILIIVVIAVVAGLGIRAWLSSQTAKTPTTEMATAEWSANYGGNMWIVTARIKNNLDRAIYLNATDVTMNNGNFIAITYPTSGTPTATPSGSANVNTLTSAPVSIDPKYDIAMIFTINNAQSSNPPKTIIVQLTDNTTRATTKIQGCWRSTVLN